ncbi:putative nucleic acid-binding Zn ribbon protein [Nocardioides soli]|uniref:Putative nucleic acid-binding Zn ribbon protein n=1 Tax=Nocardioides soli TaxID=1036020 RepID=A0A7W4Z3B9_9ACTN|nr:putative nucleic acid-binding Zn ribbon protein [Nocardioides soli]
MWGQTTSPDEDMLLFDGLCVWCEQPMDEVSIMENNRVTCSDRCRQARSRANRAR